jgi:hypothetical protein
MKNDRIKNDCIKNDRIKSDRIKSGRIKSDRIKTDRIKRITDPLYSTFNKQFLLYIKMFHLYILLSLHIVS